MADVIEARYEELFSLIDQNLKASGFFKHLSAGIVLTGGSSQMRGVVELAEEIFRMPVRLGIPERIVGMRDVVCNPIHATGVGLLLYAQEQQKNDPHQSKTSLQADERSLWKKMRRWFLSYF